MHQRLRIIAVAFLGILILLSGRLLDIQLIRTTQFSKHDVNLLEASVAQRTQSVVLHDGRGDFIDRHGQPLGFNRQAILIFPSLQQSNEQILQLSEWLSMEKSDIVSQLEDHQLPFLLKNNNEVVTVDSQTTLPLSMASSGSVLMVSAPPERPRQIAQHVIGITGENEALLKQRYEDEYGADIKKGTDTGLTGLEKALDPLLISRGQEQLLYHEDLLGRPMFGSDMKYIGEGNSFYPLRAKLTIDGVIQRNAEQFVRQAGIQKGGIVLLDVQTNDLLAMVSVPAIDQAQPMQGGGAVNYMVQTAFPGSTFKIVTAALAIDQYAQLNQRRFNCNQNVYGEQGAQRQLGQLTFKQSFAQSCNVTFATLLQEMMETNEDILYQYAEQLGLTNRAGWVGDIYRLENVAHFPEEGAPIIWGNETDKRVKKAIAQTAIGQKNVRTTPLQVANMMASIARQGPVYRVRSVEEIQYKNEQLFFPFSRQKISGGLSPYTYRVLQELLEAVVDEGTGQAFANIKGGVAGKSGTAETGQEGLVHKWFAGYFPRKNPTYALVAVSLDTNEGDPSAYDAFQMLATHLMGEDGSRQQ
ncbi:penicillin-binding protein 2 [Bacillaceae bacterium SIJ1]|uniref:penicillin-binding transpeptidase domain-containing protein n=1 Tax=Litoribacterium kuwaitense TaxID=1398745 RepID=UPI0013E9EF59|nr:penicillin-binding transpeptidase domain-containing protein [Litoribacterium kuwaitense]NGP43464.1 penicillin-binding protein 2 [Litoribacterium kuwaitense]